MNADRPLTIKELPEDERPREKLIRYGAGALSNAELLAILIRVGTRRDSAVRLAEKLLVQHDGLPGLCRLSPADFSKLKGIGSAKAVAIAATLELGKRLSSLAPGDRHVIRTPKDVADYLMARLRYESKEHFIILPLSTKNHVLATQIISIGSLNASIVHPRELFRVALQYSAASVVLVHNHPSGDPAPSREDIVLTKKLCEAGNLLEVPVLDHVIIGDGKYVSMKEKGII